MEKKSLKKKKVPKRMNNRNQKFVVLLLFVGFTFFIAYPVMTGKKDLLAIPSEKMHINLTDRSKGKEKNDTGEQEVEIVNPILIESKN